MKKWIRWQGLGLFAVFVALIAFFWLLFIDGFVERMFESQGSKLVKARVDLDKADVTLFPAGLKLYGLQITNPDEPMRNGLEIDRLAMSIDSLRLFKRKIIIDEITAQGVQFNTPRKKSGALKKSAAQKKKAAEKKSQTGFTLPNLQIPDVKDVLSKETLKSLELAKNYEDQVNAEKEKWQQQLAGLPDKKKLNQYKERLNKIKSSSGFAGLLGGAAELAAIQKEIKADLDQLKKAQTDFSGVSDTYKKRLSKLKNAPQLDINRLVNKYSLSSTGLSNVSGLLFGSKTGNMVRQALSWYEKAQPLLERSKETKKDTEVVKPVRGKGAWVRFKEQEPLPEFLIRKINASVKIEAGEFDGVIKNVTPDQDVLGVPMTLTFAGDSLKGLRSLRCEGVFNHVNTSLPEDTLNLRINGYSLKKAPLSDDAAFPVTLDSGLVDLSVRSKLRRQDIDANVMANMRSVKLLADISQQSDAVYKAVAGALSGVSNVSATAKVTGTIDDYTVNLRSDIDTILKQAIGNTLKKQTAKFEKELKNAVMAQVKGPLAGATNSFSGLGGISNELTDRLQIGGNLLR